MHCWKRAQHARSILGAACPQMGFSKLLFSTYALATASSSAGAGQMSDLPDVMSICPICQKAMPLYDPYGPLRYRCYPCFVGASFSHSAEKPSEACEGIINPPQLTSGARSSVGTCAASFSGRLA